MKTKGLFEIAAELRAGAKLLTGLALGVILLSETTQVHAGPVTETIVNNLSASFDAGGSIGTGEAVGQKFMTGADRHHLSSMVVYLRDFAGGSGSQVEVQLRSDSGGLPGAIVENLGTQTITGGSANRTFMASGSTLLEANTAYWAVVRVISGDIDWNVKSGLTATGTGTILDDEAESTSGGSTWSLFNSPNEFLIFAVNGVPFVPPAVSIAAKPSSTGPDPDDRTVSNFSFQVTRTGDATAELSVDYTVTPTGPNPASANDFNGGSFPSGTFLLGAGQTSRDLTLAVDGDHTVELDETFTVTLSNPTAGTSVGTASATGAILNNDTATISIIANGSVLEGDSGATNATFTVQIDTITNFMDVYTPTVDVDVTAILSTIDGTAVAGGDYVGVAGQTVTIPAGATSTTVTVAVNGEMVGEEDETFSAALSELNASGRDVTLLRSSAVATIVNDDFVGAPVEIVNNVGGNVGAAEIIGANQAHLQAFVTDGRPYSLNTIFVLAADAFGTGSRFELQLRAESAQNPGQPGDVLEQWAETILSTTDFAPIGFSSATGLTLAANTRYWVTMAVTSGSVRWGSVANQNTTGPGTIGDLMIGNPIPFYSDVSGAYQIISVSGSDLSPPNLAIAPGSGADANELDGSAVGSVDFEVTRSGNTGLAVAVDWAVSGSGGLDGDDFAGQALPSGTVMFAAGETTKTIQFGVFGDTVVELDETFMVTLSNPTAGAVLGTPTATGIIRNNDMARVSLRQPTAVAEGDSGDTAVPVTIEIERTQTIPARDVTLDADLTVEVSTVDADSTAKLADNDYTQISAQTVTIPAGMRSATFNLVIRGDTAIETDETIRLEIASPMAAGRSVSLATATTDASALDDDTPEPVSLVTNFTQPLTDPSPIVNPPASEFQSFVTDGKAYALNSVGVLVNGGTGTANFEVQLRADNANLPHTLLESWPGSVAAGILTAKDFNSTAGVVLQPNTRYWLGVVPQNTAFLQWAGTASPANGGSGALGHLARGNPLPNYSGVTNEYRIIRVVATETQLTAPALAISIDQPLVAEGDSGTTPFQFTLARSGSTAVATTVDWAVMGIPGDQFTSPADAADFGGTLPSGTVTFAPGESQKTLTIQATGDLVVELDDAFRVTLSNPSGAATLTQATADAKIIFDDSALLTIAPPDLGFEGDTGATPFHFTVHLSQPVDIPVSVQVDSMDGTATSANADYVALVARTIMFPALSTNGQMVSVEVVGDTVNEPVETFLAGLSNVSAQNRTVNIVGGASSATATILDDDTPIRGGNLTISPAGDVVMEFVGPANGIFTLERSNDLKTWVNLDLGITDAAGQGTLTDPGAGSLPRRFYRLRLGVNNH